MADAKKTDQKDETKANSSLKDAPFTSTGADAGTKENVKLDEGSTISTEVDPAATANPGEIKTGVAAEDIPPSGSISEKAAVADIPVEHPAVDDNPRKNQPASANRIDFNDPHNF